VGALSERGFDFVVAEFADVIAGCGHAFKQARFRLTFRGGAIGGNFSIKLHSEN
jgi:hypothetical protein